MRRRRRGFTLIEALVAFGISTIVVTVLMSLYRMATRSFHLTRRRLTAVQGAFLIEERLSSELLQSLIEDASDLQVSGNEVSLSCYDPDGSFDSDTTVNKKPLTYTYDGDEGTLSWNNDGSTWTFSTALFERVEFFYPAIGTEGNPLAGAEKECLGVRITAASHDDFESNKGLGDNDQKRRNKEVITVFGTVALPQKASQSAFPYWKNNH